MLSPFAVTQKLCMHSQHQMLGLEMEMKFPNGNDFFVPQVTLIAMNTFLEQLENSNSTSSHTTVEVI